MALAKGQIVFSYSVFATKPMKAGWLNTSHKAYFVAADSPEKAQQLIEELAKQDYPESEDWQIISYSKVQVPESFLNFVW